MKKIMLALASLAVVAAPVAASAQSFGHGQGHNGGSHGASYGHGGGFGRGGGYGYRGGNGAGLLAAGLFGAVLGSALVNSGPAYAYDQPYGYGYAQNCVWRNQAYDAGYGDIQYRQVEVCR
jgi:hypothetical protein